MSRIFLSELPSWTTQEILLAKFSNFGTITDIKIFKTNRGKSRNFGFIGFLDKKSADRVIIENNPCFLGYKRILIEKAYPKNIFDFSENSKNNNKKKKILLNYKKINVEKKKKVENISSFGKIFIRNIPIDCSKNDLKNILRPYGFLESLYFEKKNLIGKKSKKAVISFAIPECAIKAAVFLDGKIFCGRILHVLNISNNIKTVTIKKNEILFSKFKKVVKIEAIKQKFNQRSWFTFFVSPDKIIKNMFDKFGSTLKIFKNYQKIKLNFGKIAICEARIQSEIRTIFKRQGINLWRFNPRMISKKSKRIFLIKNLNQNDLNIIKNILKKFGKIIKFVYISTSNFSFIEFQKKKEALNAFLFLENYEKNNQKILLEWAPLSLINNILSKKIIINPNKIKKLSNKKVIATNLPINKNTLFSSDFRKKVFYKNRFFYKNSEKISGKILVRNIPFQIKIDEIKKIFQKTGKIISIRMPKKNHFQHRGFAFIKYEKLDEAKKTVLLNQNIHLLSRHLCVNLLLEN
jgi:RNA recognition motif-containing protein